MRRATPACGRWTRRTSHSATTTPGGALAGAADLLDRHPRLAAINGHILVGADRHLDPACEAMARPVLRAPDGQPGHPVLSFVACAVVLRRSAVLAAGGFSDRLGVGGEEELLGAIGSARAAVRALGGLPWVLRERRVNPPHVETMLRLLEASTARGS